MYLATQLIRLLATNCCWTGSQFFISLTSGAEPGRSVGGADSDEAETVGNKSHGGDAPL